MLIASDPIFAECLGVGGTPNLAVVRPAGFVGLLRIILDQQVSTASGQAMWRKLTLVLDPVTPAGFSRLDDETLRACGFSRQKAGYARALAAALLEGRLDLAAVERMPDDEAVAALVGLKGIGRWSAEVYLLLHLGRDDIWPVDDLAIALGVQALKRLDTRPDRARLVALAEPWRPWRSLAARLVWHHYIETRAAGRAAPVRGRRNPAG
ncbi:MAG: DNA-3-methyladenine glycosylase 2 family protein [Azospirillum sp.]|nr:DNA-3-methyladenine glycosylase 2 family protein [Azospirillum sp.]